MHEMLSSIRSSISSSIVLKAVSDIGGPAPIQALIDGTTSHPAVSKKSQAAESSSSSGNLSFQSRKDLFDPAQMCLLLIEIDQREPY